VEIQFFQQHNGPQKALLFILTLSQYRFSGRVWTQKNQPIARRMS
jgi:hypothetical protein